MDFDKLGKFAQDEKQTWFLQMMATFPPKIAKKMEELDQNYTVSQILAAHNDPPNVAFSHTLYMDMLKLNKDDSYPGVDVVSDWYKRNLTIFSNIRRIIDSPNDRVLVLYGSGHAKLLNDFVRDSRDLESVSPMKYLPTPPKFRLDD